MVEKTIKIKCPFCGSDNVSKNGHNKTGKQVYNCKNEDCSHRNFIEEYTYKACEPEARKQVFNYWFFDRELPFYLIQDITRLSRKSPCFSYGEFQFF